MQRRIGPIFIIIALLIFFLWSSLSSAQVLKIPFVAISPATGPLWIAQDARIFEKQGVDTQLIYIAGGTLIVQALLSGNVMIANLAPTPSAIAAWANGAELAFVAGGLNRPLHVVTAPPSIEKAENLKGKRIGISRFGSLSDLALREALQYYKLSPEKDVVILQIGGTAERLSAMRTGVVDAAMLTGEEQFQAEKLGFHPVIRLNKLPVHYPMTGMLVRRDFLRKNRETMKKFLRAWMEGIKIFVSDREFSIRVLARHLRGADQETMIKSYGLFRDAFEKVPYAEPAGVKGMLDRLAETSPEATKLNLGTFIDNSLIKELEKEGFFRGLYGERG
jgi:NitT/TauT family transport system substrate-binding protein